MAVVHSGLLYPKEQPVSLATGVEMVTAESTMRGDLQHDVKDADNNTRSSSPVSYNATQPGFCIVASSSSAGRVQPAHSEYCNGNMDIPRPLRLNVGGRMFLVGPQSAARSKLLSAILAATGNSFALPAEVSSVILLDDSGNLFIDRDSEEFADLLEYLRTGELGAHEDLSGNTAVDAARLRMRMLKFRKCFLFYGVDEPHMCTRCYCVFDPERNSETSCVHHPGTIINSSTTAVFSCCRLPSGCPGCHTGRHVSMTMVSPSSGTTGAKPAASRGKMMMTTQHQKPTKTVKEASVWRVNPAEGCRLPLVVETDPETWQQARRRLVETESHIASSLSAAASGVTTSTLNAPPVTTLSPSAATETTTHSWTATESQKKPAETAHAQTPEYRYRAASHSGAFFSERRYDMVCRPEDCPSDRHFEVVDLVCDVDIESIDFRSEGSSAASQDAFRSDLAQQDVGQLRPVKQRSAPSSVGPCWLYALQAPDKTAPLTPAAPTHQKRTKKCEFFRHRQCIRGGECQYLRTPAPRENTALSVQNPAKDFTNSSDPPKVTLVGIRKKPINPKYKTKICPQYRAGGCPRASSECKFAHGLEELRGTQEFFKTQICSFWSAGFCRAGLRCRHAHGDEDLRCHVHQTSSEDQTSADDVDRDSWVPPLNPLSAPHPIANFPQSPEHVAVYPLQGYPSSWQPWRPPFSTSPAPGAPRQNCQIVWFQTRPTDSKSSLPSVMKAEGWYQTTLSSAAASNPASLVQGTPIRASDRLQTTPFF